jgi:ABC-type nitrate/sulfonate/bicarbonate transport system substrate-binding protein
MGMRIRIAVLVILFSLPHAAFAQGKPALVRLTHGSGWDALPAVVGLERGFFAQEGLVVSSMPISNSVAAVESLIAGTSDFALVPQRTLLVMAASNLEFTVVSMNGWGAEMELVVPRSDSITKSLADLKGKVLAVTAGSEAFPVLLRLLNQAGVRPKDVNITELSEGQLTNAFKTRTADAVIELRQLTSAILRNGEGRVVMTNQDITKAIGRIGAAPLVVNNTVLKEEKETIQRFLNAWVKALAYIRKDPDDAAVLLRIFFHRQGVRISDELAKSWIGMIRYDRYTWSDSDIIDAEYNGWGLKEGNILKVQPELDGYIQNDFAEKAAKNLR